MSHMPTDDSPIIPSIALANAGITIGGQPFSVLNFLGTGASVSDGGSGVADITITGGGGGGTSGNEIIADTYLTAGSTVAPTLASNTTGLASALANMSSAGGGTLRFLTNQRYSTTRASGAYNCALLSGLSNITFKGEPGSILSFAGAAGASDLYGLQIVNCSNLRFEGMTFSQRDMTAANQQCHMIGMGGSGGLALPNDDIQFTDCHWIEGASGAGDGIRLLGGSTSKQTRVVFDRCMFNGTTRSGISVQRGIWDFNVVNCYFKTSGSLQGIHFEPSGIVDGGRWRIIGNHFDTCQASLVGTNGALPDQQSVFAHNVMYNSPFFGSYLSGSIIAMNHIIGDASFGTDASMWIEQTNEDVLVFGNVIIRGAACDAAPAVSVEAHNSLVPGKVRLFMNTIHQWTNQAPIVADSCTEFEVTENHIEFHGTSTTTNGCYLQSSVDRAGVVFRGNTVKQGKQSDGVTLAGALAALVNIEESVIPLLFNAITFTAANATEIFTSVAHGRATGDGPVWLESTGTLPATLAASTNYYMIVIDADTFYIANSRANANAGAHLSIADDGSGTHTLHPQGTRFTFTANATTDLGTHTAHGFTSSGNRAWVSNSGGALPTGLAASTDYYLITSDTTPNTFAFATTYENAINAVKINLADAGTGTHTLQYVGTTKAKQVGRVVVTDNKGTGVVLALRDQNANAYHPVTPIVDKNSMDATCTGIVGGAGNLLTYWGVSGTPGFQGLMTGTVDPEGTITAKQGTLYVRQNGDSTKLYVKETGTAATGWAVK